MDALLFASECVNSANCCGCYCITFALKKTMQKINIPLLGLTSNSEARGIKDGECSIMHNLTVDGGGTRVITPPTKSFSTSVYEYKEYYHEKAEQWLSVENGTVWHEKSGSINTDGEVEELSFMGNIVIMYCADGVRYAIYDNGYRYLGRLPKLPKLDISIKPLHTTTLSDAKYYSDEAEISSSDDALRWRNASKGYYDECLSALYSQGAFVDRTLFRWAIRLFDGSYVCYSPIYYVEDSDVLIEHIGYHWLGGAYSIGRDNKNFFSAPLNPGSSRSQYFTSVRGFIPSFHFDSYDLKNWRDIIASIELFATPSIMGHESRNLDISTQQSLVNNKDSMGQASVSLTTVNSYDRYEWKGAKKIREEVADTSLYYKIAEFDLEGKEIWRLDNTSPTQLALQSRLPINEQPHELNSASYKYIYNGKMHLGGVNELFTDAYDIYTIPGRTSEKIIQITSVVTIGTEQGERCVVTTTNTPLVHKDGEIFQLPSLLHYADARANNLRICVAYKEGIYTPLKYRDFPLTAHKTLNTAYYLNDVNLGSEHTIDITNNTEALFVDVDNSSKKNAFVDAVEKVFPDRSDHTGTYVFTFKSNKTWDLKVTYSNNATTEKTDVSALDYGLRLYIEGVQITYWDFILTDFDKIQAGDTITVKLEYGRGTLAGIRPIDIGGDGWNTLTSDDVNYQRDKDMNLIGFSLKNIKENRNHMRKNVMRVSQVDNPLSFPARNTYSFDSDIVALCSNTVAVSQGQFGQHPLYVFTDEGIWLMSVDVSGAGNYLAQIPCSREICNNAAGVSVTTRGVVFPTSKGLMLINGGEVVYISEVLSGLSTPELVHTDDVVEHICEIVDRKDLRNRESFMDYLSNSFTAFDYNGNMLYVCNPAYNYVYVYNNSSGVWSTADGQYSHKVDYSGKLTVGYSKEDGREYIRYTFDKHNNRVNGIPVIVVTRGCNFSTMDFKRVSASALRVTFHTAKMGFYTLGSVDGSTWELVGGRDFCKESATLCRDVVSSFARSRAYRYFAFAFVGEVRNDARLSLLEVAAQTDFERKIR